MVFYYYYDQLCKAISISPPTTREVMNVYNKIICFAADRHHIYLQPRAQKGGDKHIGQYKMTQEDIEQVIKDQPEIWVVREENTKEEKEKRQEKDPIKDQEKEKAKQKDKGKVTLGEKKPSMTYTRNLLRKKTKISKPTYQAVLHNDDFDTIADKVCDNMFELITTFKTMQQALKQMIEAELTEMKTLVSHELHMATPTPIHSAILEPQGNRHQFIAVTLISICRVEVQEGLQEGAMQLGLAGLPSETLKNLQMQIAEEFNEREKLVTT